MKTTTKRQRSGRQRKNGQGLVEFALLLPVLILFIFGAMDFGRAFTAYIDISSAAREAAHYGSQSLENAVESDIEDIAEAEAGDPWGVPAVADADVCSVLDGCQDTYGYSYVEVKVDYQFTPILSIVPGLETVDMSRTVRMRIIN